MDDGEALERLNGFLAEYREAIRSLTYEVLAVVDDHLAGATRMVYENFNATVVAYSPDGKSTHGVCSVAAYPRWVNVFLRSEADLHDPHGRLRGSGSTMRHVRISSITDLDD